MYSISDYTHFVAAKVIRLVDLPKRLYVAFHVLPGDVHYMFRPSIPNMIDKFAKSVSQTFAVFD